MRSCTHALALNDISLIFFWRVRHPRKHEIKKASFLGGGGVSLKKKASNENVTSAAHRIVETPDLSTKLKKNIWNSKVWNFKFKVFEGNGDYDEARDSVEEGCTYTCTQPPYNGNYTHHHLPCKLPQTIGKGSNLQCELQSLLESLIHLIT